MANKAFAVITGITGGIVGGGAGVDASYLVMGPDNVAVAGANTATVFNYVDSSQSVHEKIADQIRVDQDDPSIIVVFLDSPGRY